MASLREQRLIAAIAVRNHGDNPANIRKIEADLIDIYDALHEINDAVDYHYFGSDNRVALEVDLQTDAITDARELYVTTLRYYPDESPAKCGLIIDANAMFAESSVDDLISFEEARDMFRAEWRAWNLAAQEELNVSVKLLENGYQYESDARFYFMQKFGYMADILQTALDNMHNVRREHIGSFHTTPDWRPLFD